METNRLIQDTFTWFGMRMINRYTVKVLPRNACMLIADGLGWVSSLLPRGIQSLWMFKMAFKLTRWQAFKLNARSHARLFRDNVAIHRKLDGKFDESKIEVTCTNFEKIREILDSGESVNIATLHFSREAVTLLYLYLCRLGRLHASLIEKQKVTGNFAEKMRLMRLSEQFDPMVDAMAALDPGRVEMAFVDPGRSSMKKIFRGLVNPGNVLITAIDAPWKSSGRGVLTRPFCGYTERSFSMGTAKLARSTGRPIVLGIPIVDRDGNVDLYFGEPIRIEKHDEEAETLVMNCLLDEVEKYVGTYPDQYVIPLGFGRRWNADTKKWEDGTY